MKRMNRITASNMKDERLMGRPRKGWMEGIKLSYNKI